MGGFGANLMYLLCIMQWEFLCVKSPVIHNSYLHIRHKFISCLKKPFRCYHNYIYHCIVCEIENEIYYNTQFYFILSYSLILYYILSCLVLLYPGRMIPSYLVLFRPIQPHPTRPDPGPDSHQFSPNNCCTN